VFLLPPSSLGLTTYGAECSNSCETGDASSWCGEDRRDANGTLLRCTERTRYGKPCADSCNMGEKDYYWCWTGQALDQDWEYCTPRENVNRYGDPCLGECSQQGESYWWCRNDAEDEESWEYCSPPGQVRRVEYTTNGQGCVGECGQQGKDYWWCYKSPRFLTQTGGKYNNVAKDADWDYCSPPDQTRYGAACEDACTSRGESYFWCTVGSSWDYCSPSTSSPAVGKEGNPCFGLCDLYGETYTSCEVAGVQGTTSWWDYCTQANNDYNSQLGSS